jgi:conserved oligomeric Golgi complex subunit 4
LNNIEKLFNFQIKLKDNFLHKFKNLNKNYIEYEEKYSTIINEFTDSINKYEEILQSNINLIFQKDFEKKIQKYIDSFVDLNFNIKDEDYHTLEVNNNFVQNINKKIELNLKKYSSLSVSNMDMLVHEIIVLIVEKIEFLIFKKKFTQIGAIQLEKDIRLFLIFFSEKSSKSIRDLFLKLQQICLLLKLFKITEVFEYWEETSWRIIPNDIKKILSLRVDFNPNHINNLIFK